MIFTRCWLRDFGDSYQDPFTILAIGDQCVVHGVEAAGTSNFETGGLCTLAFSEGARTLRVTDVTARHGYHASEIELGGDDVKSGLHALYRFSGRAVSTADDKTRCAEEPSRHGHDAHTDAR